ARDVGCFILVALAGVWGVRGAGGGVAPEGFVVWAAAVDAAEGLRLDGLMTVAPLAGPFAGRQRAAFDRLMEIATRLRTGHPAATMVSAGMSADLEDAVAAGATHVRVGTAVLGVRPGLG
ncbi:alanine racemase, partial [Streptomyces sp. NPDC059612]|uniref:alanine racemase n=1 Tax=Streptomyces sp. NPDC059612 TaxID=3346885 RepID=UPI0036C575D8